MTAGPKPPASPAVAAGPDDEPRPRQAEVVIVGAGAAGAAAAWRLSRAGVDVVCLEQGGWMPPESGPTATPDWEARRLGPWHPNPNVRRAADDDPIDDADCPIRPLTVNAVGGSTVMWSAHQPRFHPSDFRMRSLDGVGEDWPLRYEELAPYYALNERMMGLAGRRGNPAYPAGVPLSPCPTTPPAAFGPAERRMAEAFDRLGWAWWPADLAINAAPYGDKRGACNHCGPCELGCPHRAKASADVTYWPAAVAAGARVVTGARVVEVTTDGAGRADGVVWQDRNGTRHRLDADRVLLAANGVQTPRLLLLSTSRHHPAGLGNREDLVGRHLMLHPLARAVGEFDAPLETWRGITAGAFVSHHFYETDSARGFLRGFKLQLLRSQGPALVARGAQVGCLPWGTGHHRRFEAVFGHTTALSICADDLPDPDNRVTLSGRRTDALGRPAARMLYRVGANSRAILDYGLDRAEEALREAGADTVRRTPLVADAGFHLMGTCRMADDPARGVTDRWGEVHGVPGLWVIDGSLFVTAAAVNPTHTIQALALRAADRLLATRQAA